MSVESVTRFQSWGRHSVLWGILASFIFHIFLIWVVPWELVAEVSPISEVNQEIEYIHSNKPTNPQNIRYVETNLNLPSNKPDETTNIASRSQQAGQTKETKGDLDNIPFLNGEEADSVKIVQGRQMEERIISEPPSEQQAQAYQPSKTYIEGLPRRIVRPPDFLQQDEHPEEDGIASMLDIPDISEEEVDEIEEIPDSLDALLTPQAMLREIEQKESNTFEPNKVPQVPRPRQRLSSQTLPGPLMRSNGRAAALGNLSVDARFTEFGDYLNRMFNAIGYQFILLAEYMEAAMAEISSRVIVEFKITSGGEVKDVMVVFTTAHSPATLICEDAIQSPSPYGPWTQDMVETLGEEQTVRITFLYR